MRLTQKFIKEVVETINLNSNSYNPTEFFKKFGGTKYGLWGCTVGLIAGLWFGPVGILFNNICSAMKLALS